MSAVEKKSDDTAAAKVHCCASCGTAEGDDIKLKKCACYLVRYCSVKCQKDHRPQHKKECKKKVAELHDELLFKQPESSHFGDCPICCLPLPLDDKKSVMMSCCSKYICNGCNHANKNREAEGRLQHKCPFCRKATPKKMEECNEQLMKRVEANDPDAMRHFGTLRYHEGDYKAAFEYWARAAALGDSEAHHRLSFLYGEGKGVGKDKKMELHHLSEAAIGGHPHARHNLATAEKDNGRYDRAARHLIIAAKLGYDYSLTNLKILYEAGYVSKEDFAAALRGHKAAIDATKSLQREIAAAFGV